MSEDSYTEEQMSTLLILRSDLEKNKIYFGKHRQNQNP